MRNTASGTRDHAPLAHPTTDSPLAPDDRVRSVHAGCTGRVVKAYADGSASVRWDDGTPQAAGLGHERMPRSLLVKIEDAAPVDLASAARDLARLIESGVIDLDAPEDTIGTVDKFLAAAAAQPDPAELSTDAVDVRFAHDVLRTLADDYPDHLPAGLHERATEALERLESAPYRAGGYAGLYAAACAAEALLTRQKHLPGEHTAEGRILLALRAALGGES